MQTEPGAGELGLCATCMYAEECAIRSRLGKDALYCDEFVHRAFGAGRVRPVSEIGLCPGCSKRANCDRARTEEGVWWCDDYRCE